jgi:tetratricopeptide (TPR) repeat protein
VFHSSADRQAESGFPGPPKREREGGSRITALLLFALLALPSSAAAQRDPFFAALLNFYRALGGGYGDEGPQLSAHLESMSTALARWDEEISDWERQVRPRLNEGDPQVALQVHTFLASLYMERGRFDDALREFDEDIRIDPRRAAFPRFKGLIHQAALRSGTAADAFWAAWQLDPADPQNAYRLIAFRSAQTTDEERARALETLQNVERDLVKGTRPPTRAPFVNIGGILDDAGGGMAFVPAAYAHGFSLVLKGDLDAGVASLRSALAADPLVADAAVRTPATEQGLAALRQGQVTDAIKHLETTVAQTGGSSEGHRMLATAYAINGEIPKSLDHLREAIRLNPRDERSWIALARTLDQTGRLLDAQQAVRDGITALPDAGALRWQLAAFAARDQRTVEADVAPILSIDRYVLLAGRGDLYVSLARFARTQLDFQRATALLEQAIALNSNNIGAHKALGRAYIDDGREDEGYVEFVVALMLDPGDEETRLALARVHLAAGRADRAVEILERSAAGGNRDAVRALGEALVRTGRTAEGEKRLQESERLQAEAVEEERRQRTAATLALQAEVRMTERDYAGAIELWQQVVTMRRDGASTHLRVADALVAVNRLDEAAAAYQMAISLNAGAEAHRRLADVYQALGRREDSARERASYIARQLEELRRRTSDVLP